MANIELLKAELISGHPGTGAYDADPVIAAGQLNAVNRTKNRASMSGDELFAATDSTEFASLTVEKKANWLSFCGRDTINPFGASNVAFVQWVFGGGSTTVASLAASRTTEAGRAEELGIGFVRPGHVTEARA